VRIQEAEATTMDRISELRTLAKQQYTTLRESLSTFEERVVAHHWYDDTAVRSGFEHVRGSLDRLAGWLFADEEISPRGTVVRGEISGDEQEHVGEPVGPVPASQERPAVEDEQPSAPDELAPTGHVEVTFTLPAEVRADSVALCGEFNQWSAEALQLERGIDGMWQATVALKPGRSYRYRYLIDGERWENDWRADRYEPNPYGSADSVVVVEPSPES
jgi:hypothetical protein